MTDEQIQERMRIFIGVCVGALVSWAVTYLWLRGL